MQREAALVRRGGLGEEPTGHVLRDAVGRERFVRDLAQGFNQGRGGDGHVALCRRHERAFELGRHPFEEATERGRQLVARDHPAPHQEQRVAHLRGDGVLAQRRARVAVEKGRVAEKLQRARTETRVSFDHPPVDAHVLDREHKGREERTVLAPEREGLVRHHRLDEAEELASRSVAVARGLGPHARLASSLQNLGAVLLDRGRYEAADAALHEAEELLDHLRRHVDAARVRNGRAFVAQQRGQTDVALARIEAALAISHQERAVESESRWFLLMLAPTPEHLAAWREFGDAATPIQRASVALLESLRADAAAPETVWEAFEATDRAVRQEGGLVELFELPLEVLCPLGEWLAYRVRRDRVRTVAARCDAWLKGRAAVQRDRLQTLVSPGI